MNVKKIWPLFFLCVIFSLCSCQIGKDDHPYTTLDEKYLSSESSEKEPEDVASEEQEKDDGETKEASSKEHKKKEKRKENKENNTKEKSVEENNTKEKSAKKETAKRKTEKEKTTQSKEKNTKKDQADSSKISKNTVKNQKEDTKKENESAGSGNTCTITIECSVLLKHMDELKETKKSFVPKDGKILDKKEVSIDDGDSVYDILYRVCRENNLHMESKYTPVYSTYYVEGINQLYEFDCGKLSGWIYFVNGEIPNYGCSSFKVNPGDVIVWSYTCNAGKDVTGTS